MKRNLLAFAVMAAMFAVSCGSGANTNSTETETTETETTETEVVTEEAPVVDSAAPAVAVDSTACCDSIVVTE